MPHRPEGWRRCGRRTTSENTARRCTPITTPTEYEGRWYVSAGVTGRAVFPAAISTLLGPVRRAPLVPRRRRGSWAAMGRSAVTRPWPTHGLAGLSQGGPAVVRRAG